jgi:hypothetical protein
MANMIDEQQIRERKEALMVDLNVVQTRSAELEKKRLEDTALANALTGAIQQCDDFLKRLNDVTSDVGNSGAENLFR